MPTYDYICRACEHEFELFQQMTEPVKRKCPACGKPKLERLIGTGAGVLFKGGGFYETDYRSDSYKKAAEAESKPATDSKADAKTETKTDAAKKSESEPKAAPADKPKAAAKPRKPKAK
jgi:putative FmdB family regulatory protein